MMDTLTRLWQHRAGRKWGGDDGAHWMGKLQHREAPAADIAKGVFAGAVGGLIAAWLMNQFQAASSTVASKLSSNGRHKPEAEERESQEPPQEQQESPTVQAAQAVAAPVLHRKLTLTEKQVAGPAVHYGYGALMGGLYGGLVEAMPDASAGFGTAYATALFVGGDEIGVPLFGFSGPPWKTPVSTHANAFGAHLVYGLATEGTRRLVRRVL